MVQGLGSGARVLCWTDEALRGQGAAVVSGSCDPWHLISGADRVITDADDELALIAIIAGLPVQFHDVENGADSTRLAPSDLVRTALERHAYTDPFTAKPMRLDEAIALCAFWRSLIDGNRPLRAAIGFAAWKQPTAAPLLWAGSGVPFVTRPSGLAKGAEVAAWKSRVAPELLAQLEGDGLHLIEVEDGFIRSIGLGADCVPPLSLVLDRAGIYFDPLQPSDLENILQYGEFPADLVHRARHLRAVIVARGISKYAAAQPPAVTPRSDRPCLLVPGQVEDDRSVLCGGGAVTTNLELLRRARQQAPGANIVYKPHPDVEAGHRTGALPDATARRYADEIVADQPISALIDRADAVHVNTSLAGFEALLRGKPVTTHGVPFYAGWGLTNDLGAVPPRRTARRTIDELVVATLLVYPRYLDPATGLPCTAETLVDRLAGDGAVTPAGPLVRLRRLQGAFRRRIASLRGFA